MKSQRKIYVSEALPEESVKILSELGSVIKLPMCNSLPLPVASHPDMLMFECNGKLIISNGYYIENKALFEGERVITDETPLGNKYPDDILFDALALGEHLISYSKYTSERIKECFESEKRLNVKQGYTKCSALSLGLNGVITSDKGICSAVKNIGINALLIEEGGIVLPGYSTGFIGGASAVIGKNVIFFGDPTCHASWREMEKFISLAGYSIKYTEGEPLCDYGGAIVQERGADHDKKQ